MKKDRPFFVNAFPPHDKREDASLSHDLDRIHEEAGSGDFAHTLFTVGSKRIDPFILSQVAMSEEKLSPLVAVNPVHQHPVSVAKKLATLSHLFPNKLAVNLISGSFFREHKALGDESEFAEKSARLLDFTLALRKMLLTDKPVFHEGKHYPLKGLELSPQFINRDFRFFVSGAHFPELADFEDTWFVKSLRPVQEQKSLPARSGFLVGVCARKTTEEAREAVANLFPEDEFGKRMHEMSLGNEMTPWNAFIRDYRDDDYRYYLNPMRSFWSPAPFIVGSYEEVAGVLREYENLGATFFILDYHPGDYPHVKEMLRLFRDA